MAERLWDRIFKAQEANTIEVQNLRRDLTLLQNRFEEFQRVSNERHTALTGQITRLDERIGGMEQRLNQLNVNIIEIQQTTQNLNRRFQESDNNFNQRMDRMERLLTQNQNNNETNSNSENDNSSKRKSNTCTLF